MKVSISVVKPSKRASVVPGPWQRSVVAVTKMTMMSYLSDQGFGRFDQTTGDFALTASDFDLENVIRVTLTDDGLSDDAEIVTSVAVYHVFVKDLDENGKWTRTEDLINALNASSE